MELVQIIVYLVIADIIYLEHHALNAHKMLLHAMLKIDSAIIVAKLVMELCLQIV